jgi:hypothetical protein
VIEVVREYQGLIGLAVSLLVSSLVAVIAIVFRSQVQQMIADRASAADVARVAHQVDDVDRRVMSVEARLGSLPTSEQLQALALRIESLSGDVRATLAQLAGTNEMLRAQARRLELVDEYLHRSGGAP